MKNRIIIAAAFTACLALCAAVWPQTEKVGKTPAPSETAAVTTPRSTLPEPEELILPEITEKQESGMPEAESAQETTTEELPVPAPEIEDEPVAEQKSAPPTQTDPTPVQPAQLEPKTAPESIANDNELADMVYVPGFGWIESQGPNQVEYAEDMKKIFIRSLMILCWILLHTTLISFLSGLAASPRCACSAVSPSM